MLDIVRKKKRSWVVTFLLAIIVIVFVAFYGNRNAGDSGAEKVASINGEPISQRDFAVQYQKVLDNYRNMLKGELSPEMLKGLKLKSKVMEDMIDRRVVIQETRRLGLTVSDDELMSAIGRAPEFQIEGRFSKNRYLQLLNNNRVSAGQFEEDQREQLLMRKLLDVVQDNARVSEAEVRDRYAFDQEKVSFAFIRLGAGDFLSQTAVTDADVKSYYDRNKAALTEPLKVRVEYVAYPFDHFAAKAEVGAKEIEDYYNRNREARFEQKKALKLRHILVRSPGADAAQKTAARAKAEAALAEARAGKNFAEIVKQYSDDPGPQGGDLGWVNSGQLMPSLDGPVFALKKGEVSGVLESPLGYHIFKVEDVKEEKKTDLKEATPEIIKTLRTEKGKTEAVRAADQDREKATSGSELSLLAKERGLAAKQTPLFGAADTFPEIGALDAFKRAAFALAVKEVGAPVEAPNAYYLLRVVERREPTLPPLTAIRADVERKVKEAKALDLAKQKAKTMLEQLKKEKNVDAVAKANGLQAGETGWFLRGDAEIPKVGELADVKPGGIPISAANPVADIFYVQGNNIYLFAFKGSQGADMARFDGGKERLIQQALQEKRQAAVKKFVDSLKARSRIEVEQSFLEES
ncbi:MAG TPA: SurA N-terminal domain-containing protein [Verrucomicrobiae bacterium]|jgi:peptidyl-prolyl cis-trans isomerase D|nr:SurA N-terminal domain-containing protein [Verrucomicrobiae bacterium]